MIALRRAAVCDAMIPRRVLAVLAWCVLADHVSVRRSDVVAGVEVCTLGNVAQALGSTCVWIALRG